MRTTTNARRFHWRWLLGLLVLGLCCPGVLIPRAQAAPATQPAAARMRVGTYDSRALAVAFARSDTWKKELADKMEQHNQAKADGDEKKVKELEAWGKAQQRRLHRQGFSNEPVDNILAMMKDQLPQVARDTDVSVIVSKADWHDDASVQIVDVTDRMVQCFSPDEQTLKVIAELRQRQPVDLDAIDHQH